MAAAETRSAILRNTTYDFCKALLSPPPSPADLLAAYFTNTSGTPNITEHGPAWASSRLPFLGKTFTSREGCEEYFQVLGETLEMELPDDAFPGPEGFVVDAECEGGRGMVSVVGKGRFRSKKTGRGWSEEFVYRFSGFDAEGRIGHWEIWADPLSAWEAVGK